jgi:prepilin-type N-terminal cleavage/methylation domain-containing protein
MCRNGALPRERFQPLRPAISILELAEGLCFYLFPGNFAVGPPVALATAADMKHSRTQRGFSLLELIVVVGLIGVISAIAVPMFGSALADFRLRCARRRTSRACGCTSM